MKEHTPGPWVLNTEWLGDDLPNHIPVSSKKGQHLALAQVVWSMEDDTNSGVNSPTCEANARLIAAAPELLEALKTLLEREWQDDDGDESLTKARQQAQAAIAKATKEIE
jgi:hypothetical protein